MAASALPMPRRSAVRPELAAAAAAATALALPVAVRWLLRADLPVALLLGLTGGVAALQIAAAFAPAPAARPLRWAAAGASALFGASILVGIVITPFSSYRLWFLEVAQGAQQGAVSNLFALIAGWAFSSAAGVVLSSGFAVAAAVLAVIGLGLAAVIVQSPVLYPLTLAAVALAVAVLALRGVPERAGGGVVFAAAIVLLAAGAGLLFPAPGGGNYFVDLMLHPRMRAAISSAFPRFPLLYSIPGFGTQHDERRLGGTPVLSPRPLLRVHSAEARTLYLRTEVFDHYDGATWAFTQEQPAGPGATERFIRFPPPLAIAPQVRVELVADAYDRLPHTVDTDYFSVTPYRPQLAVADYGRGFFPLEPILRGVSIGLRRDPAVRAAEAPPEGHRYLQVPASLPDEVRALAAGATRGAAGPTDRLRSIERYLKSTGVYSLTPPTPGRGQDFIGHFLLGEQRGYCVHFATAFTIFARLNGIPARYVSGYLVHFPVTTLDAILTGIDELDDPDLDPVTVVSTEAVVTGLAAHTWAEVWLPPHGWTTWEATPAVNPGFTPNLGAEAEQPAAAGEQALDPALDPATARQLSAMLGRDIRAERRELDARPLLAGAAALLLAAVAWAAARMILTARARLRASPIGRVAQRYVKLAARAGVPQPDTTGWLSWERSFGARLPQAAPLLSGFTGLFVRVAYAGYRPTAAEVAAAAEGAAQVRRTWYRSRAQSLRHRLQSLRPGRSAEHGGRREQS